jgi:hypothetical protein
MRPRSTCSSTWRCHEPRGHIGVATQAEAAVSGVGTLRAQVWDPDPYAPLWRRITAELRAWYEMHGIAWGAFPDGDPNDNPTCEARQSRAGRNISAVTVVSSSGLAGADINRGVARWHGNGAMAVISAAIIPNRGSSVTSRLRLFPARFSAFELFAKPFAIRRASAQRGRARTRRAIERVSTTHVAIGRR